VRGDCQPPIGPLRISAKNTKKTFLNALLRRRRGVDGEEKVGYDAAAPLPHAVAPVGAPSAAAAGLHAEVFAAGVDGTNMRQCWSARRKATANDKNSSKVRRRED